MPRNKNEACGGAISREKLGDNSLQELIQVSNLHRLRRSTCTKYIHAVDWLRLKEGHKGNKKVTHAVAVAVAVAAVPYRGSPVYLQNA